MNAKILKVKSENNSSVTFTLKSNAFNIFEEPENNLWTFDLEGRLVGMFIKGENYRRTLDNTFHLKTRQEIDRETFRNVENIEKTKIIPILEKAYNLINNHINDLPDIYQPVLRRILGFNIEALQKDASSFSEIYLPISILPPDQYMSLVIQLTEGCNYNQCTFCNFYKDRPFKIKTIDELHSHILNIKNYFGEGIKLRKAIFLADANAIAIPQDRLINALDLIQSNFEDQKELYSFIDVFTGLKKSTNDFKELKQFGLNRVYLGIESGNSDLMSFLKKDQLNKDIIELTNILHTSGINIGVIFLVGAGGQHFAADHIKDSVDLLEKLNLNDGDIVYLSELYQTNSDYIESMHKAGYDLPTKLQIRAWSNLLKEQIRKMVSNKVQVSIYDINQFFY